PNLADGVGRALLGNQPSDPRARRVISNAACSGLGEILLHLEEYGPPARNRLRCSARRCHVPLEQFPATHTRASRGTVCEWREAVRSFIARIITVSALFEQRYCGQEIVAHSVDKECIGSGVQHLTFAS